MSSDECVARRVLEGKGMSVSNVKTPPKAYGFDSFFLKVNCSNKKPIAEPPGAVHTYFIIRVFEGKGVSVSTVKTPPFAYGFDTFFLKVNCSNKKTHRGTSRGSAHLFHREGVRG